MYQFTEEEKASFPQIEENMCKHFAERLNEDAKSYVLAKVFFYFLKNTNNLPVYLEDVVDEDFHCEEKCISIYKKIIHHIFETAVEE